MTTTTTDAPAQAMFDALIEGLQTRHAQLAEACREGLCAIGGRALPALRAAFEHASAFHRALIKQTMDAIDEHQDVRFERLSSVYRALLLAVQIDNPVLQAKAVAAMRSCSAAFAEELVKEAICNFRRPTVCLRILHAVEQLGGVIPGEGQFDAAVLVASENQKVRELARTLFSHPRACRHDL